MTDVPVRSGPTLATYVRRRLPGPLMRLELRRNAMLWTIPILAGLFYLTTYLKATELPPLWGLRIEVIETHSLIDFAPFVAGAAAWMGSRDGRRGTSDLVATTARSRWSAQLAAWLATAVWATAAYLGCIAVAVTAAHVSGGGPQWWPVAGGAAAVIVVSALGFVAGAFVPSRFSAPLAAAVALLAVVVPFKVVVVSSGSRFELLFPTSRPFPVPVLSSEMQIARVILLAGVTAAALGALGVLRGAVGPKARVGALMLVAAGVAAAGIAVGLVDSARL
jgi:hypothetical protein